MQSAGKLLEHPVISNDARTGWSNQFLNGQCEPETKPNFHRFCGQRRYLAKDVLKHEGIILLVLNSVAQTSQENNLYDHVIFWVLNLDFGQVLIKHIKFIQLLSSKTTVTFQLTHMGLS